MANATPAPSPVPPPPIPQEKLHALVIQACDNTLKARANPVYQHEKVKDWSQQIITNLLNLLKETHPHVKWFITCSLIQAEPHTTSTGTSTSHSSHSHSSHGAKTHEKGVFIAQGAWWDNAKDGMRSFDLWGERGYGGVDITVSIAWITA